MFDSTEVIETVGGFPRGNKAVDSAFFAKMISSFYANGVLADNSFAVTPAGGRKISISGGVAWVNGYMAWLEEATEVTLTADATYAVLIRLNLASGDFHLVVTDSVNALPTRTDSIYDLILAEITVPEDTTEIVATMITDTRADSDKCGYVRNAIDALGEANHAVNSDKLGGYVASSYLRKTGGTLTGSLVAASDSTGDSLVRNIRYGSSVPSSLANGEIFILLDE